MRVKGPPFSLRRKKRKRKKKPLLSSTINNSQPPFRVELQGRQIKKKKKKKASDHKIIPNTPSSDDYGNVCFSTYNIKHIPIKTGQPLSEFDGFFAHAISYCPSIQPAPIA